MSWTCAECGAVWAPWFPGPCNHPVKITTTTDTILEMRGEPHEHEYVGLDTTAGRRCKVCGCPPPFSDGGDWR